MDAAGLRAAFPVFARFAYLNAGTCGPLPASAAQAIGGALVQAVAGGRTHAYFEQMLDTRTRLRESYAQLVGAATDEVALTTCTSEGLVRVLNALDLQPGDEVVTSDEEHPGLQGPLAAARDQRGVSLRVAPFAQIAEAVGPQTKLVACSHVSWVNGQVVRGLSDLGDVPVLLDGAQGVGAIPLDMTALGCSFYAGSGQKWLCGPIGTGMLWVSPAWIDRLPASGPTYLNLVDVSAGLDAVPLPGAARHDTSTQSLETLAAAMASLDLLGGAGWSAVHERAAALAADFAAALARRGPAGAARHDTSTQSLETLAAAMASLDLLGGAGWSAVHERAAALAADFAAALAERGHEVAPRDRTTLVSWKDPDPPATRERLAEAGVIIRDLPGTGLLRASVGAWNDHSDLDRLLTALG